MKPFQRLIVPAAVATAALIIGPLAAAGANGATTTGADHAVFVQTNDPAGNQVLAFHRGDDGRLIEAGRYATGGRGGVEVGAAADTLASQGSLAYDNAHGLLLAVNAGSDT